MASLIYIYIHTHLGDGSYHPYHKHGDDLGMVCGIGCTSHYGVYTHGHSPNMWFINL